MNQEQRRKLYEKGFWDGVESVESRLIKSLYGAAVLAAHREFKFGPARCHKLLMAMDKIVTTIFTDEEMIEAAWKECGVKIVFKDGIEPFQIREENEK